MTGISTATLRSWERRYGVPSPARTLSSYRLYSDNDVMLLERMRDLCRDGMSPAQAADLVRVAEDNSPAPAPDADPFLEAQERIVAAVKRFDSHGIESGLRQSMLLGSGAVVLERVVVPVLGRVGELWHDGVISAGHEHLLTEIVVRFAREALNVVQPGSGAPQVLLACFDGELHSLPLYVVAFHFAQLGYRALLLGAMTPPEAVAAAVAALKPHMVGLSVSMPPGVKRAELVQRYADAIGSTPWIVGGAAAGGLRDGVERAGGIVVGPGQLRREIQQALASRGRRPGQR